MKRCKKLPLGTDNWPLPESQDRKRRTDAFYGEARRAMEARDQANAWDRKYWI